MLPGVVIGGGRAGTAAQAAESEGVFLVREGELADGPHVVLGR